MSRKRRSPAPPLPPPAGATPSAGAATAAPRRRWHPAWMLAGGGVLVLSGAVLGWREATRPARLAAQLPARTEPVPGAAAVEHALAARLAQAAKGLAERETLFPAIEELGRLYHANSRPAEAAACWEILRREQPRTAAQWNRLLADAHRSLSDYDGMERALAESVKLAPDDAAAWLQLAGLRFKSGRIGDAADAYARRLALKPGDEYAELGLVRCAQQSGRADEARLRSEALVKAHPDFPPAHNLFAEFLAASGDAEGATRHRWLGREAGRFREAEDPLLDGLAAWCLDPERLRTLGTVQFQTKRGDRGLALFQRAVELAPNDPAGPAGLGELWLELGEPAKARESLLRALELSGPGKAQAAVYVNLARAWRELGRPDEALEMVRRGIREAGDSPDLQSILGLALADTGNLAEAERAYRVAVASLPQDANVRYNFAAALLEAGKREEGKAELKEALRAQPTFTKALELLGKLETEDGKLESAGAYWKLLYESQPGMPAARRYLATWHGKVGAQAEKQRDPATAEQHYRAGVQLVPDDPELNANLGVLLLVQGRIDEALAPLEEFRRQKPADPQAAMFLAQANARLGRLAVAKSLLEDGARLADKAGNAQMAEFCREMLRQF